MDRVGEQSWPIFRRFHGTKPHTAAAAGTRGSVPMIYMLDTDICVELIRKRSDVLLRRLTSLAVGDVAISSITLAELAFGAEKSREPNRNRLALAQFVRPLTVAPFEENA